MGAPVTPPRISSSDQYKKISRQEKKQINVRRDDQKYHPWYEGGFSN